MENVFVARQPIFRRDLSLYGYELLFRSGVSNAANIGDGDSATSEVIMNTFTVFGLDDLVGEATAFINLTRRFLVETSPLPLPTRQTVIEILEDIRIDDELIAAVERLKADGYTIALDDFHYTPDSDPLLHMADIVKLEMSTLNSPDAQNLIDRLRQFDVKILAEKIEDYGQLERCRSLGCDYFQGFFLSRPDISATTAIPTERLAIMELLAKMHDPKADIADMETVIGRDLSLSYKLLRYINSAFYRRAFEIRALRQAIMMLGMKELRRWGSIVSLCNISDKPDELVNLLLIRAKMADLLAKDMFPDEADACFIAGLFSGLDAMLDRPMEEILQRLPLADEIKEALLHRSGPAGQVLTAVLGYEEADPSGLHLPQLTAEQVRQHYLAAVHWQQQHRTLF
ncbi:EAL and HDOD domain-containing protein [Natronospira bacteriovora]|uniref:HDOD domain-containing protein n=1 Tax=Natronospira bacteriovora TaxID=3069753 RepID=A0ABU0W5M3_9GAMM|nr:HDOD domain-containing protein [Natronospira sp. AB-CW4]MDQ2069239.1 HDOD domain-containing protein [Natronospira sp. AB-CW4]